MEEWSAGPAAVLAVASAEAHVADPLRMVEALVDELGELLAAAVLGLDPSAAGAFGALEGVVGEGGGPARLRLAFCVVSAVGLAAGTGAAALWLRLPDPLLGWEPAGLVLSAWPVEDAEPPLMRSAASFIDALRGG